MSIAHASSTPGYILCVYPMSSDLPYRAPDLPTSHGQGRGDVGRPTPGPPDLPGQGRGDVGRPTPGPPDLPRSGPRRCRPIALIERARSAAGPRAIGTVSGPGQIRRSCGDGAGLELRLLPDCRRADEYDVTGIQCRWEGQSLILGGFR